MKFDMTFHLRRLKSFKIKQNFDIVTTRLNAQIEYSIREDFANNEVR